MTDDRTPTAPGGAIRAEAATWFARMRGPGAKADRADFEAWLADSPLHRDAYNRIGEVFALGKGLDPAPARSAPDPKRKPHRRRGVAAICAALLIGLTGVGSWTWRQYRAPAPIPAIASNAASTPGGQVYATPVGAIRTWRLADGSKVTLDTDSLLKVAYAPGLRSLRLLHGRARFEVAHETRPFVVSAGAGTVTAHGTIFDVRIQTNGGVAVRLLRGAIDVALPVSHRVPTSLRQRLVPGQQLVFDAGALPAPRTVFAPVDGRWPDAMLDCDQATLAAIVAEANRYSPTRIVIGDPQLDGLQVSGSFRIDDPDRLAQRLGILFDLGVDHDEHGRLVLTRG
jgi:transmembrane sensor